MTDGASVLVAGEDRARSFHLHLLLLLLSTRVYLLLFDALVLLARKI